MALVSNLITCGETIQKSLPDRVWVAGGLVLFLLSVWEGLRNYRRQRWMEQNKGRRYTLKYKRRR